MKKTSTIMPASTTPIAANFRAVPQKRVYMPEPVNELGSSGSIPETEMIERTPLPIAKMARIHDPRNMNPSSMATRYSTQSAGFSFQRAVKETIKAHKRLALTERYNTVNVTHA